MIDWIVSHWLEISAAIMAVMHAADRISDLTPTKRDDKWVEKARKLLKLLALKNPKK